jgi:purine-binding chemotaxis protein CheW
MSTQTMTTAEAATVAIAGEQQLVLFQLEGEDYGVDIYNVQRLIQIPEITPVPRAPDFVAGVIEVRGDIIPVINLKTRFGFEKTDVEKSGRIVITEIGEQIVGFLVDAISEVTRLSEDDIEPPSSVVKSVDTQFISGVGKQKKDDRSRLIIILDVQKLLNRGEQALMQEIGDTVASNEAQPNARAAAETGT